MTFVVQGRYSYQDQSDGKNNIVICSYCKKYEYAVYSSVAQVQRRRSQVVGWEEDNHNNREATWDLPEEEATIRLTLKRHRDRPHIRAIYEDKSNGLAPTLAQPARTSFSTPLFSKVMGDSSGSTSIEYDVHTNGKLPCYTDKDCQGICPIFCKKHFCKPNHECAWPDYVE
ncbi:hypothetical protein HAX54_028996 [Datura stramonium]|uniref:Uncharacterized protein n=1 Tax=Datura stramonium TaxID=4076 RepID=A0ABS8V7S5_DATST|nr:hypothetical protein [Datura stramonium]